MTPESTRSARGDLHTKKGMANYPAKTNLITNILNNLTTHTSPVGGSIINRLLDCSYVKVTMRPEISPPEQYYIKKPTPHVPNSPLPVLVYRSALPLDTDPKSACDTIEPNNWLKGGIFKHYSAHHFHSVTHECYAVFKGNSRLLLGRGPLDPEDEDDLLVDLKDGDAIVLPAGVSHCNIQSSDDYEYLGFYPKGSPHWDNNFCKASEQETREKAAKARAVPIPDSDPIFGVGGPLADIWNKAALA